MNCLYLPEISSHLPRKDERRSGNLLLRFSALPYCTMAWLSTAQLAQSSVGEKLNMVYEVGELFELGIQLSYLLILIGLLGAGTFFVIRQVLVRRELDLSAKELQVSHSNFSLWLDYKRSILYSKHY
jgi:hypothetical protein